MYQDVVIVFICFFGGLGVHNFYLGYTKKALIQLFVNLGCLLLAFICLILGIVLSMIVIGIIFFPISMIFSFISIGISIWGLVEGIMILAKSDVVDANGNLLV